MGEPGPRRTTDPQTGAGAGGRRRIERTAAAVGPVDAAVRAQTQALLDAKVKPAGSLGRLEDLACQVAAIRGTPSPPRPTPAVVVCAGDHGYADHGVSAYPQAVTRAMLRTFADGGSAVCVLAREAGARLRVADVGVRGAAGDAPVDGPAIDHPVVLDRRVRAGTRDATRRPAMTDAETDQALAVGLDLADRLVDEGVDLIAVGEMGIGNTTAASAVTAALLDRAPEDVCGRGTGIGDAQLAGKVAVVRAALARTAAAVGTQAGGRPPPLAVLAHLGGLEIAALVGVVLAAAARSVPVLLDGFVTAAAALVAARAAPRSVEYMIAGHRSPEPGHALVLADLGLTPLLDLGLRLGEGTGATLTVPLVRSAVAILTDMATFTTAGVPRHTGQQEHGGQPGDGRPKPPRGDTRGATQGGAPGDGEVRRPRARAEKRRDASGGARAAKRDRRRATADAAREALRPAAGWEVLHGRRPVVEALRAGRPVERVLVAAGAAERGALAELTRVAHARRVEVRTVPRSVLDAEVEGGPHQGVAAVVAPIGAVELDELLAVPLSGGEPPFFLAVDAVTDPHNLGALARSAEAAGCHGIVVPRHNRAPLSPVAVKSSAGALEHIPVAEVVNLTRALQKLQASGFWCLGLAEDAEHSLFQLDLADEPVCVVVGGEGGGLHRLVRETCDHLVSIPMGGKVASLNASVAGALAMFEVRRRRGTPQSRS